MARIVQRVTRKKMDRFVDDVLALSNINAELTALRHAISLLESDKKILEATLLKAMGAATIGTINSVSAIKIGDASRRSVTIDRVLEFAPEQAANIIQTHTWKKVNVL